jgi:hypothetical protein
VRQEQEPVSRGDLVLERFDAGLEELDDPSALIADQVVVVVSGVEALVAVSGFADAELSDDACFDEELERPVDRGPGDLLVLGPEPNEQFVCFDVFVLAEHLVEQGLPFGRELEAPPFQVLAEDLQLAAVHVAFMGLRLCLN